MKTYFELPLDSYNQPNGQVRRIEMTLEQFKNRNPNRYIFENEIDAIRRAQD